MVCEQISHHPPLTAFHFENLDPGFSLSGTVGNRAKFRGTYMRIKTDGSATLTLRGNLNETYVMTYPVRGGVPYCSVLYVMSPCVLEFSRV